MIPCKMPKAVYFGEGALDQLASLKQSKKVAVFSDRGIEKTGLLELPLNVLKENAIPYETLLDLPAEPTCDQAEQVVEAFQKTGADAILAVGGGSVMDVAKLCSILADGSCSVRDLLADPKKGHKSIRTVMIPTTAGTGAEATPNAIVAVP